MLKKINAVVWLRRDLRLHDHRPLQEAVLDGKHVQHVFVFDTNILDSLTNKQDRRVEFIHESIVALEKELVGLGGSLVVLYGDPVKVIPDFCKDHAISAVYVGRDQDPYGVERDGKVLGALTHLGVQWHSCDDHTVVAPTQALQPTGKPYVVFTPYFNRWRSVLQNYLQDASVSLSDVAWLNIAGSVPTLHAMGFSSVLNNAISGEGGERQAQKRWSVFKARRIEDYLETRDYPSVHSTSGLSVHFRFGTIAARQCVREVFGLAHEEGVLTWIKEIAWRDFYAQLLYHFPKTIQEPFQTRYDTLLWSTDAALFKAWATGKTGYPLVDAAQRQLVSTGFMHNRLRMVSASFFSKHLGLDWRLGEAFFAEHLNDYDAASNVGGWQWASSIGSDAQPYFRVFNPTLQSEKFDRDGTFIRQYCPELSLVPLKYVHAPALMTNEDQEAAGCMIGKDYPAPIVEHRKARLAAIDRFKNV